MQVRILPLPPVPADITELFQGPQHGEEQDLAGLITRYVKPLVLIKLVESDSQRRRWFKTLG